MAKFFGAVGFSETVETVPGIWNTVITERKYKGDIIRNVRKLESSGDVNDDVNISNEISIIADAYANNNLFSIRYVELREEDKFDAHLSNNTFYYSFLLYQKITYFYMCYQKNPLPII